MLHDLIVPEVELDKLIVTFPAFIPEAVIIVRVYAKVYMKPIFIARILTIAKDILKCPESSSDMIENTVKNDFDSSFMEFFTNVSVNYG